MSDEDAARNRSYWTAQNASSYDGDAERAWAQAEIAWGVFQVPERTLEVLGEVRDLAIVELGCGTAYFSAWLARRGARPIGVDVTPAQLATARRCQQRFGLAFPLIEANAERVPLPDASADLVLSEYGASLWCDPALWIPEAARLLRPGGRLVFLTSSVLLTLCFPDEDAEAGTQLMRPQRDLGRIQWPGAPGVEFHPSHGDWIRVLRDNRLTVERLAELYAPDDAAPHPHHKLATPTWARQWPVEEVWVARKLWPREVTPLLESST